MRSRFFPFFFVLWLAACTAGNVNKPLAPELRQPPGADVLGIEVQGLRLSAAGYMLDFRYRVHDPGKAAPLFDRSIKPYIVDEATGARLMVPSPPKIGPLRQTTGNPAPGRTYFILFANPGKYLEPGKKVTVVIGDHRLEHLVVQ